MSEFVEVARGCRMRRAITVTAFVADSAPTCAIDPSREDGRCMWLCERGSGVHDYCAATQRYVMRHMDTKALLPPMECPVWDPALSGPESVSSTRVDDAALPGPATVRVSS